MKRILLVFVCAFVLIANYAQVKITASYKDGTPFDNMNAILENDTCLFALNSAGSADWIFFIDEGNFPTVWQKVAEIKDAPMFELNVKNFQYNWFRAKSYKSIGNGTVYYHGMLVCGNKGARDTIALRFDIAPSKPIIHKVTLHYDYFAYEWCDFVNLTFDALVEVQRPVSYFEIVGIGRVNPSFTITYSYEVKSEQVGEGLYRMFGGEHYLDDLLYIEARGDYGCNNSDTICINDYIEDPDIREFVNVKNVKLLADFKMKNGKLLINGKYRLSLYTVEGRKVLECNNVSEVDVSSMPSGIYLLKLINNRNQIITKKIRI